jgi:D-alanyl-D-alanine carboxypeptidase
MSNTGKAIAFGAIFLTVGLGLKLGSAAIFSEKDGSTATASMIQAVLPEEKQAFEDISEIPGKKEPKAPETLDIRAGIVIDLTSGEEIFSVNKLKRWPLASVSKLMSSIVAFENMELDEKVTISENAVATEGVSGGFQAGDVYTVEDLVYSMMVVSSNDAAIALREAMSDNRFVELMNAKAEEIGMISTYFNEPSGLSILNQSTASDIGLMIEYAWVNHPELFSISSGKKVVIKELNSGLRKTLTNINALSSRRDFIGGKTGYTEDSSENLAAVFSLGGKSVAVIILGAEDRANEAEKIISFINNDINSSY